MARLLLRDLTPGTDYYVQVRAVEGDSTSEWSRKFPITTTTDTTPPDVPAWAVSNEHVVNGDTFVSTWQALDFNLSQNKDFDHYELELSDTVLTTVIRTTNISYTLTYENNRIFFGTPKATVTARVRSVDAVGNVSAWSSLKSATNPAPSPVNSITTSALYDNISVKWDGGTLPDDFKAYVLQVSTTSSSSGFSTIYTGPDSQFQHATTMFTTDHWFRVYVQDKFGTQSSAVTSSAVKPKSAFTIDSTPPGVPTSVTITQGFDTTKQEAWVNIAYTAPSDTDLDHFEVRYSTTAGSNWQYVSAGKDITSVRIEGLIPLTSYYVDVRAVDYSTNASAWVNQSANYPITTNQDSSAPSQPAAPTASVGTMRIQVSHNGLKQVGGSMEPDVAHYEVFASTTNGFTTYDTTTMLGTIQAGGPVLLETFDIAASAASGTTQTWYVKVRAVDRAGNKSTASNQATAAVGLIATANIGDAQITNAKINDLAANKITAGTINTGDISVESKFILGTAGNDGVIESYDYGTSGGTTGFSLDSDGLVIKTGAIEAAALKIQNGQNIIPPQYADFEASSYTGLIVSATNGTGTHAWSIDVTNSKFNTKSLKLEWLTAGTSTYTDVYMGSSSTDYNIIVEANQNYIVSGYFMTPNGSGNKTIQFVRKDNISEALIGTTQNVVADGTWQRFSAVMTTPAGATKSIARVRLSTLGTLFIDGLQIEKQQAALQTPSEWKAPSTTTISGGLITTGAIRSNTNLTINGVTLPTWSIDTSGAAQFGDLLIRGNTIVGSHVDEGSGSFIKSYNYDADNNTGWIIGSDGVAEFRQVTAGTFDGTAIRTGTLSVETLTSSTLTKRIELGLGSSLAAVGGLGEEVSLSQYGFRVYGPDEVAVTNRALSSGTATITTEKPHGYTAGSVVYVDGVESRYNGGPFTVVSTPTTTTYTYLASGSPADETSTASTGLSRGRDASGTNVGPKYIDFPTDGTQPNIISGLLTASTLVIQDRTSMFGTASVENAAVLTIASSQTSPASAPTVSVTYNEKILGVESPRPSGACIGHDNNLYVINQFRHTYKINKHNRDTGAYISNVVDYVGSLSTNYTFVGLAYLPSESVYYYVYRIHTRDGTDTFIEVLDTNFDYVGDFQVDSDVSQVMATTASSQMGASVTVGVDLINNRPLIAYRDVSTGNLKIRSYNIDANGVPTGVNSTLTPTGSGNGGITTPRFIGFGAFDLGSNMYVFKDQEPLSSGNYTDYTVLNSSGAPQSDLGWPTATGSPYVDAAYWDSVSSRFMDISGGYIREYATGDSYNGRTWTITTKALTSNVATLTTSAAHDLNIGDNVVVAGVDATFNGTYKVTALPSTTQFSYAKTASNVSSTSSGGTAVGKTGNRYVTYTWYAQSSGLETTMSPATVINSFPKRGRLSITLPSIPGRGAAGADTPNKARIYVAHDTTTPVAGSSGTYRLRNTLTYPSTATVIDPWQTIGSTTPPTTNTYVGALVPAEIRTTSGNSYWKGDDTAKFYKLELWSNNDVNTNAGNTPALRIGSTSGVHLRMDGNEIQAMQNDNTAGNIGINLGGGGINMAGNVLTKWNWGLTSITTGAGGLDTISHGLGTTPVLVLAQPYNTANPRTITVEAKSSTTFTTHLRDYNGNDISATVSVMWIAIA